MKVFWFTCTRRYYLTRPWLFVRDLFDNLRWMWQRMVRGWDDRAAWGLSYHLAWFMPQWIDGVIEASDGVPCGISDAYSTIEEAEDAWHELLEEMADGFRAGYALLDGLMPENEKAMSAAEGIDGWDEWSEVYEAHLDWAVVEEQMHEAAVQFKRGMELFQEYFFQL